MSQKTPETVINLLGVIVAVTDEVPRVLVVDQELGCALPNGPFDPSQHASLEDGLSSLIEEQTGLDLYYIEQLYTFGNRNRDPAEIDGGPRVVSVAYIALTHEDPIRADSARWADWYQFLPWEDWRNGRPEVIEACIGRLGSTGTWTAATKGSSGKTQRGIWRCQFCRNGCGVVAGTIRASL
jgi:hypothetical protein